MADKTRFYRLTDAENPTVTRLVDATSQSAAIRHCSKRFTAKPVTTRELAELLTAGTKIEKAGPDSVVEAEETEAE